MTEPRPTMPTSAPRPAHSILGRLAGAVRRQDWFTVALEVVIVVLGVVIGFQVTAWGQARSDAAREQRYLRQLAADLRETARLTTEADSFLLGPDRAGGQMWAAFYAPEAPPRDSVFAWRSRLARIRLVRPVLGTAEALVATGDLALVRDDSLRSAISAYLDGTQVDLSDQDEQQQIWWAGLDRLDQGLDIIEAYHAVFGQEAFEEYLRESPAYPPLGKTRIRFPLDAEALLSDREMLTAAWRMTRSKDELLALRSEMRDDALALLRRVEAQIDP